MWVETTGGLLVTTERHRLVCSEEEPLDEADGIRQVHAAVAVYVATFSQPLLLDDDSCVCGQRNPDKRDYSQETSLQPSLLLPPPTFHLPRFLADNPIPPMKSRMESDLRRITGRHAL